MEKSLDIVELIENNPITRLTNTYQNKLITKIKNNFTDTEQQLFVSSFYCFLNYNQRDDFVIDLDNVWRWIGFSQKVSSKRTLEKHFVIDIDYKILLYRNVEQDIQTHGGHNKETILMNIRTFKLFCLKAGTKKAEQIHEYYIKLEETLQEVIQEESDELKLQLECKDKELENKEREIENKDKEIIKRDRLIIKKEVVFLIRPDIQDDIYYLYCLNNELKEEQCGIAHIPDYKTSVMMNKLFRIIKENNNLDALEESDDEDEFENENIDKFVKLDTSYKMVCKYMYFYKNYLTNKLALTTVL
jgi:hypothetical protein